MGKKDVRPFRMRPVKTAADNDVAGHRGAMGDVVDKIYKTEYKKKT